MNSTITDTTEALRAQEVARLNNIATVRTVLEKNYGKVWDTAELQRDFEVRGFAAPFVVVTRRADGAKGSLSFQHNPRFYFDWSAD